MSDLKYNVQMFHEFTLQSCFNESYLPAFSYYGGNILYYLLNTIGIYKYDKGNLMSLYEMYETREEMEKKAGIASIMYIDKQEDIVPRIIDGLNNKKMFICRTLNSWAYDERTSRKTEVSNGIYHWNLVFGYDSKKEEFDVIEHLTNAAALYYPMKMKYDVLEQAYENSFLNPSFEESLYVMWKKQDISHMSDKDAYQYFINKRGESFRQSMDSVKNYIADVADMELSYNHVLKISDIIKSFQIFNYIILLFQKENETGIDLINSANLLRTYYIKWIRVKSSKNRDSIKKYTQNVSQLIDKLLADLATI
ncbi:MAG: hypothetical protein HFG37_06175 [Eubacterium sp.]|nr:hypothetical protein [Eubacterium sp.]